MTDGEQSTEKIWQSDSVAAVLMIVASVAAILYTDTALASWLYSLPLAMGLVIGSFTVGRWLDAHL